MRSPIQTNFTGERVGELFIDRPVHLGSHGAVRWLCRCDCGEEEEIPAARIAEWQRRNGEGAACRDCRLELIRGKQLIKSAIRHEKYVDLWYKVESLYSAQWENLEYEELRKAIGVEEGTPALTKDDYVACSGVKDLRNHVAGFIRLQAEYPSGWGCEHEGCREVFLDGYGCLGCAVVLCLDHAPAHNCLSYPLERTLSEIGDLMGPAKERIRQIQERALRKLRHPSRAAILQPFYQDEPVRNEFRTGEVVHHDEDAIERNIVLRKELASVYNEIRGGKKPTEPLYERIGVISKEILKTSVAFTRDVGEL